MARTKQTARGGVLGGKKVVTFPNRASSESDNGGSDEQSRGDTGPTPGKAAKMAKGC